LRYGIHFSFLNILNISTIWFKNNVADYMFIPQTLQDRHLQFPIHPGTSPFISLLQCQFRFQLRAP